MDLPFADILFMLPPRFTIEAVIVRAMERTAMGAPTPIPAAAHPLSMKASA